MKRQNIARLIVALTAVFSFVACDTGPTQPVPTVVSPAPTPPPAPPPAPPVYSSGFVGTETDGFVTISGPSGESTSPYAINDAGQVVGSVDHAGGEHAFIWSRTEGLKDLGVLPGDTRSFAKAINANGDVVGFSGTADGLNHAFRWTVQSGMVGLPPLDSCSSTSANGINANGVVVGACGGKFLSSARPVRWNEKNEVEELASIDQSEAEAIAVNDRGEIVGYVGEYYGETRGVFWNGTTSPITIDGCITGSCYGEANAINAAGDAVGTAGGNAFLRLRDGPTRDLGRLPGSRGSIATGVNDLLQVVGVSYSEAGVVSSFTWSESAGMRELVIEGRSGISVSAINNKGQIVGYSR